MILKALYDYYYRSGDLAPAGIEIKEIAFLIVIDKDGNFIRLEDRRIDKKNCSKFAVAKELSVQVLLLQIFCGIIVRMYLGCLMRIFLMLMRHWMKRKGTSGKKR